MHPRRFVSRSLTIALPLAAILASPLLHGQTASPKTAAPISVVRPEAAGFSSEALRKLDEGMQGLVDQQHLAGIVTLVARRGQVVQHKAYGVQDVNSRTPMKLDTIARIYSMTKPITGVAMMMLYEEGKWHPSDPIAKHIPEFANLNVYAGENPDGTTRLVPASHAPTMGELMSHTAGFTYGFFGSTPVDKLYQADNPLGKPSLKAFIDRMAKLPLLYQPGERWVYSVSVDIQGYLVEKLSGRPFPEFLRTRIFEPLGMPDTGFLVPKEQLSRVATIYAWDKAKNALVGQPHDPGISQMPGLPQGGGGLYSTAADYLRFAQMLLNRGELGGVRILKPASVEMMRTSVLSDQVLQSKSGIGQASFSPAQGFGYDFAVVLDPVALNTPVGKGTYWWWGAAGTWFWIDPANEVIFIGIIQRRGGVPGAANHETIARSAVYGALTKR